MRTSRSLRDTRGLCLAKLSPATVNLTMPGPVLPPMMAHLVRHGCCPCRQCQGLFKGTSNRLACRRTRNSSNPFSTTRTSGPLCRSKNSDRSRPRPQSRRHPLRRKSLDRPAASAAAAIAEMDVICSRFHPACARRDTRGRARFFGSLTTCKMNFPPGDQSNGSSYASVATSGCPSPGRRPARCDAR